MIYLDNAATTRVNPDIMQLFASYQTENFYNPSAVYGSAAAVKNDIERARTTILNALHGNGKFIFASSGSECDNLALLGCRKTHGSRIIVSAVEHPAVYNTAMELRQRGYEVVEVATDNYGVVDIEAFKAALTPNTALVSIMHVNNETGAVNDIKTLVKLTKACDKKILFHCDGVQGVGKTEVNLSDLGVDMYTVSGHKIHAPKGIAGLFVRTGVNLQPIIFGGGQEGGVRSSTENVGGIVAFAEAVRQAVSGVAETNAKLAEFYIKIKAAVLAVDDTIKVVSGDKATPHIFTFAMRTVRGEVMSRVLEGDGIVVGTGSACSSQKAVKRVPSALGIGVGYIDGIIRLSFSAENTDSDVDYFIKQFNLEYSKLKKYGR